VIIKLDDVSGPEIQELLREHLEFAAQHSPRESIHALDVAGLQQPDVSFWTAWEDAELLGCGALKELADRHGEIKSMRTSARHLRKGVASQVLSHLITEARHRGYTRLSLETGSMAAFAPARALYSRFGFVYSEPFANYVEDPYSMFMTLEL
jgi:putative acetyltransferase